MAQDYKLHISIDGLSTTREEENKEVLRDFNNKTDDNNSSKKEDGAGMAVATMAAKEVVDTAMNTAQTYVGTIGAREDNVAKQNRINNVIGKSKETVSSGMKIATAAMAGSAAGPWGAVIAAGVAAAVELGNAAMNMASNALQYNQTQMSNYLDSARSTERLGTIATNRNR